LDSCGPKEPLDGGADTPREGALSNVAYLDMPLGQYT